MQSARILLLSTFIIFISPGHAAAEGDAQRGGQVYRICVACHSLQPKVHLTGPSLSGLWGKRAASVEGFVRNTKELRTANIKWDENTLNAWLSDPRAMVPGTTMFFRGIKKDADRADLIAFLKIAMAAGGDKAVIAKKLVSEDYVRGQQPRPLINPPKHAQVVKIRHCGDAYFIMTADGTETPYWEKNLRLKIDSQATGPEARKPVVLGAGMRGDRFSVIFKSVEDIKAFVSEKC